MKDIEIENQNMGDLSLMIWQRLHFDVCLGYLLGMWWIKGQFPVWSYEGGFLRSFISWRGSVSQIGPWWHSKSGSISAKYIFVQCTPKPTIWVLVGKSAAIHVKVQGQMTHKNKSLLSCVLWELLAVRFIFMSLDLVFLYLNVLFTLYEFTCLNFTFWYPNPRIRSSQRWANHSVFKLY